MADAERVGECELHLCELLLAARAVLRRVRRERSELRQQILGLVIELLQLLDENLLQAIEMSSVDPKHRGRLKDLG